MASFIFFILSLFSTGEIISENPVPQQEKLTHTPEVEGIRTYYFIRHAEKVESDPQNQDPQLTEAGKTRAKKWAEVFRKVNFDCIFSTDYQRTRQTAEIIAASQGKEVQLYDVYDWDNRNFPQKSEGNTVLIVGHSNTNPELVNRIIGRNMYFNLDEKEYGSLFIVTVAPDGSTSSQVLFINSI